MSRFNVSFVSELIGTPSIRACRGVHNASRPDPPFVFGIGGPSKMTFGTSNLLVFFVAEGYTIIKGVLDSTRPGLHNGLRKN